MEGDDRLWLYSYFLSTSWVDSLCWCWKVAKLLWLCFFMLSCLFVFTFPLLAIWTKRIKANRNWNFTGPINNCMHLDFSFYSKLTCFMHCIVGGCIFGKKNHASFESFSSEKAKSLFGPSVPSRPAVCTYSVAAPCLACDFQHFPQVDFFPFARESERDRGQVAEQV